MGKTVTPTITPSRLSANQLFTVHPPAKINRKADKHHPFVNA
jgi:hypothetical protein